MAVINGRCLAVEATAKHLIRISHTAYVREESFGYEKRSKKKTVRN